MSKSNVFVEELDTVDAHLNGLTKCMQQMRATLKEKVESPEISRYIGPNVRSEFSVITAVCKNNGIGINNKLPWKLKREMDYFNRVSSETTNEKVKNIVIMGRKTWSSIPAKYRPLEGRTNVVLSRAVSTIEDRELVDHIFSSLSDALEGVSQLRNKGTVWVIGGQSVYEEAIKMPECKKIYITRIDADFECDTFFPEFDTETEYKKIEESELQEENDLTYKFYVYERCV